MSKEGKDFILDLNLYLVSSGKSEREIKEFIEEAEEHLRLGEAEGKTVRDIFGDSPEEYAKSVANEMKFSKKEFLEAIVIFMFGVFMWMLFSKIEDGTASFSKLEVICTPLIYLLTLVILAITSKKLAFKDIKFNVALFILFTCNIGALVVVGVMSKNMPYFLTLNRTMLNIIIIACFVITLIFSIKIKYYISFLPFIWKLPNLLECLIGIRFNNIQGFVKIAAIILAIVFMTFENKRVLKE